jgi:hypothetical protein
MQGDARIPPQLYCTDKCSVSTYCNKKTEEKVLNINPNPHCLGI